MIARPPVFISAVSEEFSSTRDLVAKVLHRLGFDPVWQDVFGTEHGDLRAVLRKKIDGCKAVIQLVGYRYGAEPPAIEEQLGRVSYTQYEARYAKKSGKNVYYFIDTSCPPGEAGHTESGDLRRLQEQYRESITSGTDIFTKVDLKNDDAIKNAVNEIRDELAKSRRAFKYLTVAVIVLLLMILTFVVLLWGSQESLFTTGMFAPKTKVSAASGSWAWDRFASVRVAQATAGMLLGDEPYVLQLELKNRTTMPLIITSITVLSRNKQAAQLLGQDNSQVFKAEIHVPRQLNGHEAATIEVGLNEILPKEITVLVYHNHSETPSEFDIDLGGKAFPMPAPRHLAREQVFAGYDSMLAIQRGTGEARRWSADAQIVATFPGDKRVYIDEESRLKHTVAESWVTTFYSPLRNRMFTSIASANGVQGQEVTEAPDHKSIPPAGVPGPTLGYQQVLDLANRASMLSADWKSLRLGPVEVQGRPSYAWFLPYRAPSGLPLIIDAVTGEQLVPHAKGDLRPVPLQPAALIP